MKAIKRSSTSYKLTACFLACYYVILESISSQIGGKFMLVLGFHTSNLKHPSYRVNPSNVTTAEISIRLQFDLSNLFREVKTTYQEKKKKNERTQNSLLELEVPTKFVGATMCKVERLLLTTFSILKAISKKATRLKRL